MVRAIMSGVLLFCTIILAGAFSIALIRYYPRYDIALLFPLSGVACLVFGDFMLRSMERNLGFPEGGADAAFLRSFFVASVIWFAASGGLLFMVAMSNGFITIFNFVGVPRYIPMIEYSQ